MKVLMWQTYDTRLKEVQYSEKGLAAERVRCKSLNGNDSSHITKKNRRSLHVMAHEVGGSEAHAHALASFRCLLDSSPASIHLDFAIPPSCHPSGLSS